MFGKAQLWSLFRYAGERPLRKTYLTVSIITVSNMFQTLLNNRFIFNLVESGVVLFQIFSVTSYLLIDCSILKGLADRVAKVFTMLVATRPILLNISKAL